MDISALASSISSDLMARYHFPWRVFAIETGEGDVSFEIVPSSDEQGCFVGFRLHLNYTRLSMELSVVNAPVIMTSVFKSIESNGKKNIVELDAYGKVLSEKGFHVFEINGERHSKEPFSRFANIQWLSFSSRFDSSFVCVHDNLDFHYENFKELVALFAGFVLLFSDYSDGEELMYVKEGKEYFFSSSKYERNPLNREICLLSKGYKCAVCGVDMESVYGDIGSKYIEIHHIIPVSEYGEERLIDPLKELIPVCPNCHAMLHRKNPPYTVEEMKNKMMIAKKGEV